MKNPFFALMGTIAFVLIAGLLILLAGCDTQTAAPEPERPAPAEAILDFAQSGLPIPEVLTVTEEEDEYTCETFLVCFGCEGGNSCSYFWACSNGRRGCVEVNPLLCRGCQY